MIVGKTWAAVKRQWVFSILLAITTILAFFQARGQTLELRPAIGLLLFAAILTMIDKQQTNKEFSALRKSTDSLAVQSAKSGVEHEATRKALEQTRQEYAEIIERRKTALYLLNALMNRGLISEEDALNHLKSEDLYAVYCFPTPLPQIKGKKNDTRHRLYPELFEKKLGFIRMGKRSTFYVNTTKRLPKELRAVPALKTFILNEINPYLKQEWEEYLSDLKKSAKHQALYAREKTKDYNAEMEFTLLVIKSKFGAQNTGYAHQRTFPKDFYELLKTDLDFEQISLSNDKKVKVKEFVFDSSIELLFFDAPRSDFQLIKTLEPNLRKTLGITSLFDYSRRNTVDIVNILAQSLSLEAATKYATVLQTRANEYVEALKELGING